MYLYFISLSKLHISKKDEEDEKKEEEQEEQEAYLIFGYKMLPLFPTIVLSGVSHFCLTCN